MWQFKRPEEGSNAETSVILYRHLASIKYILTLTCKFTVKAHIHLQVYGLCNCFFVFISKMSLCLTLQFDWLDLDVDSLNEKARAW